MTYRGRWLSDHRHFDVACFAADLFQNLSLLGAATLVHIDTNRVIAAAQTKRMDSRFSQVFGAKLLFHVAKSITHVPGFLQKLNLQLGQNILDAVGDTIRSVVGTCKIQANGFLSGLGYDE